MTEAELMDSEIAELRNQRKAGILMADAARERIAKLERDMAEVRPCMDDIAKVAKEFDSTTVTVFGLPCICDTPKLHSEPCVAIRKLMIVIDNAARALPEAGK